MRRACAHAGRRALVDPPHDIHHYLDWPLDTLGVGLCNARARKNINNNSNNNDNNNNCTNNNNNNNIHGSPPGLSATLDTPSELERAAAETFHMTR